MRWRRSLTMAVVPVVAGAAWMGGAATASGGHTMRAWSAHHTLPGKAAASVAAAVHAAKSSGNGSSGRTLILVERAGAQNVIDVGPSGDSPGDAFVSENALYDSTGKHLIGRDLVRCEQGIRTFTCEATGQIFGHGKIRIAGTVFTENENTYPVTGGTGAFRGAGGQLTPFDVNDTTAVLFFQFSR
jgi:allene oxide cyclase